MKLIENNQEFQVDLITQRISCQLLFISRFEIRTRQYRGSPAAYHRRLIVILHTCNYPQSFSSRLSHRAAKPLPVKQSKPKKNSVYTWGLMHTQPKDTHWDLLFAKNITWIRINVECEFNKKETQKSASKCSVRPMLRVIHILFAREVLAYFRMLSHKNLYSSMKPPEGWFLTNNFD